MAGALSALDLQAGAMLGEVSARAFHEALRKASDHICRMPANYLTFPGGRRILKTVRTRATRPSGALLVDSAFLSAFGTMRVPRHLWTAMQHFAVCFYEVVSPDDVLGEHHDDLGRITAGVIRRHLPVGKSNFTTVVLSGL